MQKRFRTISEYHNLDPEISVKTLLGDCFRVSLLSETSNDIKFTSTDLNGIVADLTGTTRHLTRMDGICDETPTHAGDVALVPPGLEVHLAWTIKGPRQNSIMVEFETRMFERYLPELNAERLKRGHLVPSNYAQRPELAAFCRLLGREVEAARPQSRLYVESVMRLLAMEVAGNVWSTPQTLGQDGNGKDPRIHRAVEYVEAHYATDVSLLEISRASGLSPTHLTSLFQRETGHTPYSYVIERRLRQAVHLLRATDLPIAQVAHDAGFADQQHMTRVFRVRLKQTPKSVRVS